MTSDDFLTEYNRVIQTACFRAKSYFQCTSVQSALTLRSNAKVQCSSHVLKTVRVWNNGRIPDRWHVGDLAEVAYRCLYGLFATHSLKSSSRRGTKKKSHFR